MPRLRLVFAVVIALLSLLGLGVEPAHAQATRTWVSGVGDDANPCSRTAPCKTFAGAISKTTTGGEINVLDPGGFGTVTITKSITIDGAGAHASILASGTNGVNINAPAGALVTLRNLSINGAGTNNPITGILGVNILNGGAIHIENCAIAGFTTAGIEMTGGTELFIKDTNVRNIGVSGPAIYIHTATLMRGTLDRVRVENSAGGIRIHNGDVTIRDSISAGHASNGLVASAAAKVHLENSLVSNNGAGTGVLSDGVSGGAVVYLSNTTINYNLTGIATLNGGTIVSFGNNHIQENGTNGIPTMTIGTQ